MDGSDREDYSWILRGKQRKKIMNILDKPKIPTQIKNDSGLSLNNVSDVLREFRKKGLAKCLNPKDKTGRLYKLTFKGRRVRELMEKYK